MQKRDAASEDEHESEQGEEEGFHEGGKYRAKLKA